MTNQLSLLIRPMDVHKVACEALRLVGNDQGKQCYVTGIWYLPSDWKHSLPATLIAWAIMARRKKDCFMDPALQVRGQRYEAKNSLAICCDPDTLESELQDFAGNPGVLEAIYEEQFMDRVMQPLQLIQNLRTEIDVLSASIDQVEDTVEQIYEGIRYYGIDFCPE